MFIRREFLGRIRNPRTKSALCACGEKLDTHERRPLDLDTTNDFRYLRTFWSRQSLM